MFSPRDSRPIVLVTRRGDRVLFRSTLEARWSVYFDLMAFSWNYEPFRFNIGGGITYTPDFSVEEIGLIEIKPNRQALNVSLPRIAKFIARTGQRVYGICGDEVSPNVVILAEHPLRIVECDRLPSKIILAGKEHLTEFKNDPDLASVAIESSIKASNNARIKCGESKTPQEREIVAKWKHLPVGFVD